MIYSDPRIARKIFSKGVPSKNWKQRALYLGSEGAKAWLAWAEEFKNDLSDSDTAKERDEIISTTHAELDAYVSLGVGDADIDYDVCTNLYATNDSLKYIPVDISDGLLHFAHGRLAGDIPIPFAILSDFEERMDFISSQVKSVSSGPVMYSMLGCTIGTLDLNERKFLMSLQTKMKKNDYLVFDFVTTKGNWDFKEDKNSGRLFESTIKKQFIANGLSRQVNESFETIMEEFDNRVDIKDGYSDVNGAISYKIFDTKSKK